MRWGLLLVLCGVGCSSANFDVASNSAADSAIADTLTASEVSSSDADGGCIDKTPIPPCAVANSDFNAQIDIPKTSIVADLVKGTQLGFHMKMPRNGRVGEVLIRMLPQAIASGAAGSVTLQAFTVGCVPRPVGKVTLPYATQEDWKFAFNNMLTALPTLSAGEELNFILYTDSDMYTFRVYGGAVPMPNPNDLFWAKRTGTTGDFTPVDGGMLSVRVSTYACG